LEASGILDPVHALDKVLVTAVGRGRGRLGHVQSRVHVWVSRHTRRETGVQNRRVMHSLEDRPGIMVLKVSRSKQLSFTMLAAVVLGRGFGGLRSEVTQPGVLTW
jgi:hypothetical protein